MGTTTGKYLYQLKIQSFLQTPTLKAAGSNPVGRTMKKLGISMVFLRYQAYLFL